ncbi:MAG: hypothetical protein JW874_12235 [Spirochaetales bacterium]|nr:hypothetical protein [Spirochaetales bacterium]
MKRLFVFLFILMLCSYSAGAGEPVTDDEETLFGADEDDVFSDDSGLIDEKTEENSAEGLDEAFLVSDKVILSGSYSLSIGTLFSWAEDNLTTDNLFDPDNEIFTTKAGAVLIIDARPDTDFRFFTKVALSYPYEATVSDPVTAESLQDWEDIFKIQEVFSDFQYRDALFFRAGKYTVKWGVGYRWSPADIINITPIDPEHPDEAREGPLSVKIQYPFSNHNLYFYLLADNPEVVKDLAWALKGEFLLDNAEFGTGFYWKPDTPPYAMATLTFGSGDFNYFAEAVGSYGTLKHIIEEVPVSTEYPYGLSVQQPDEIYFSGLVGFIWSWSDEDKWFNLGVSAEYFYNGYGYADPDVVQNPHIPDLIADQEITVDDLVQTGRHYVGVSFSWKELFESDVSFTIDWLGNLSDFSGKIIPKLSFDVTDILDFSVSVPVNYGNIGDEYARNGTSYGISFNLSIGGGRF